MSNSQMLSVRISEEDLRRLDELAAIQGRPRSQLIQETISDLVNKNERLRNIELMRLQKRLKPAIKEQCELMDSGSSFSDEYRGF